MPASPRPFPRSFKTKHFAKIAKKSGIDDTALCKAIKELGQGKATDLGGGVFKKRIKQNDYRSIIVAKSEQYWVFEFLFAKNDADNITAEALRLFRTLAQSYAGLSPSKLQLMLANGDLQEICHD